MLRVFGRCLSDLKIYSGVLSVDAYLHPVLDFSRSTFKMAAVRHLGYSREKSEFRADCGFRSLLFVCMAVRSVISGFIIKNGGRVYEDF